MQYIYVNQARFGYYYHPIEKKLYLFDKSNNRMVRSFGNDVLFIHQYSRNNKVLFAVGVDAPNGPYLTSYDIYGAEDSYYSDGYFKLYDSDYKKVCLGNDCFILKDLEIVSLRTEQKCGPYDNIFYDAELLEKNNIPKDSIIVSKVLENFDAGIMDEIVFGLDMNSFKVTTPIYSQMQKRFIKKYTKRAAAAAKEKFSNFEFIGFSDNIVPDDLANETVRYEVLRPFVIVGQQLAESEMFDKNGNIKEDFVKRLGDKNGNSKKNN